MVKLDRTVGNAIPEYRTKGALVRDYRGVETFSFEQLLLKRFEDK